MKYMIMDFVETVVECVLSIWLHLFVILIALSPIFALGFYLKWLLS